MSLHILNKIGWVRNWFKIPAMTPRERAIYKRILLSLARRGRPLDIFEYGSGYSTVHFARFLKRRKISFHLDSIDNHAGWHERVKGMVAEAQLTDFVTLHLAAFTPFWEKPGWKWDTPVIGGAFAPSLAIEEEYIQKPVALNKKFDLIVVDGRFRRRCLEVAGSCLKEGGVLFLHDAQSKKYHAPLAQYKGCFIDGGKYFPLQKQEYKIWVSGINLENKGIL